MNTKVLSKILLVSRICVCLFLAIFTAFIIAPELIIRLINNCSSVCLYIIYFFLLCFFIIVVFHLGKSANSLPYTDSVTNDINCERFKAEAKRLIEKKGAKAYAIIQIDINKFKYINERYGFSKGNELLKWVNDTIKLHIKENELCARLLGDWFVVLIKNDGQQKITRRIKEIISDLSNYHAFNNSEHLRLSVKCGVYELNDNNEDINHAIEKAILAGQSVVNHYKSAYAFYDEKLIKNMIGVKQLEDRMVEALKNKEFIVYFQPKYSLADKQIYGAEALVRWEHPEKGLMLPIDFIPIFEKNGFIVMLDKYVFETVCKQIRWWIDNGYPVVPVSVNISRVNLYKDGFVDSFAKIIKKYNIPANYVELELTESAIIQNQNTLNKTSEKLRANGISLSIDDFGNGYSCLSLLGIMPFDTVKIDKRFLLGNFHTDSGRIVIERIVDLVKTIHMRVVAEGVETSEQADFLKSIGCDIVQGYLFSPPINIEKFNNLILRPQ
ncbi:MAG: bifunctional diguanylate cyclase/phosphodiesterase [Clostridiaceae bacterium]|nr:bifunctional diguanylate cyclase/phosphodiesterase [Clostridiaceae bacterium]